MLPHRKQYELDQQRQQDYRHQAAQHRLAQVARGNHQRSMRLASIYKPTLYRLGKQLESIGTHLQIRYGDLKPSALEQ